MLYPHASHSTTSVLWVGTIPRPWLADIMGVLKVTCVLQHLVKRRLFQWVGLVESWESLQLGTTPTILPRDLVNLQFPLIGQTILALITTKSSHNMDDLYSRLVSPHTLPVHHGQPGATMEPELRGSSLLEMFMIVMEKSKNKETASTKKRDASFPLTLSVATSHGATCKFNICQADPKMESPKTVSAVFPCWQLFSNDLFRVLILIINVRPIAQAYY